MGMQGTLSDSDVVSRLLCMLLLLAVGLNIVLIAGRVLSYTPLWMQPGAPIYVLEPLVLLLIYASTACWITTHMTPNRRVALLNGSAIGAVTGVMWVVNLSLETFVDLSGLGVAATAPFLLGGFALWGLAGSRAAWLTTSVSSGVLAAVWSAMICVLMTITAGFVLTFTALPHLEHLLVADPDFLRSHWHDLRAFAIANTFDSAFSHLLGGLIVGTVAGLAGSLLGLRIRVSGAQGLTAP